METVETLLDRNKPVWKPTNYGVKPLVDCPLINNNFYEIGYYDSLSKSFHHQGVRKFFDGFKDDDNYYLKPFPSHYKEVVLIEPTIF